MTFVEIMENDGYYVADSFREGIAFEVKDGELFQVSFEDSGRLLPSFKENPIIYKGLFSKDYRRVGGSTGIFKDYKNRKR